MKKYLMFFLLGVCIFGKSSFSESITLNCDADLKITMQNSPKKILRHIITGSLSKIPDDSTRATLSATLKNDIDKPWFFAFLVKFLYVGFLENAEERDGNNSYNDQIEIRYSLISDTFLEFSATKGKKQYSIRFVKWIGTAIEKYNRLKKQYEGLPEIYQSELFGKNEQTKKYYVWIIESEVKEGAKYIGELTKECTEAFFTFFFASDKVQLN